MRVLLTLFTTAVGSEEHYCGCGNGWFGTAFAEHPEMHVTLLEGPQEAFGENQYLWRIRGVKSRRMGSVATPSKRKVQSQSPKIT